ncbi:AAA family ATPase [Brucella gallinifaecis]|uniref:CobQ/CobB/MinD/ParA nucleotide binding domain-containing protein n=1 Tax=Brucella gallinifaecis TaxID=215590 RepID=A0A502BNX8_9HYPH|nr:AAA family ATPase [Brucella gallinifaecis]TPF75449.1 hypothetical protein FHY56_09315 [Brucella gallinifaecis]
MSNLPNISIGFFTVSEELELVITELKNNGKSSKARIKIFEGGSEAAIRELKNSSFDLIVVEFTSGYNFILRDVEEIASLCQLGTKAIILGHDNDIQLYRSLIACGVSDYINAPFNSSDIFSSITRIFANKTQSDARVIGFIGAKGGVGSSTISHNIATYTAEILGKKTILLDFDLQFGTSSLSFNKPSQSYFDELINSSIQIDELFLSNMLVKVSDNLSIFPYLLKPDAVIKGIDNILNKIIEYSSKMASIVIIDMPNKLSNELLYVVDSLDDLVVVAEQDIINVRNTSIITKYMDDNNKCDSVHLIINKEGKNSSIELFANDFKQLSSLNALAVVPFEAKDFRKSEEAGKVIISAKPQSRAAKEILTASEALFNEKVTVKRAGRIRMLMNMVREG